LDARRRVPAPSVADESLCLLWFYHHSHLSKFRLYSDGAMGSQLWRRSYVRRYRYSNIDT